MSENVVWPRLRLLVRDIAILTSMHCLRREFRLGRNYHPQRRSGSGRNGRLHHARAFRVLTDPDLNAWYTSNGEENGDLCNYNYGTPPFLQNNGASYNAAWGGYFYLIQLIWKNGHVPQSCAAAP